MVAERFGGHFDILTYVSMQACLQHNRAVTDWQQKPLGPVIRGWFSRAAYRVMQHKQQKGKEMLKEHERNTTIRGNWAEAGAKALVEAASAR